MASILANCPSEVPLSGENESDEGVGVHAYGPEVSVSVIQGAEM